MRKRLGKIICSSYNGFVVPDTNIRIELLSNDHPKVEESIDLLAHMFCNYSTEAMLGGFNVPEFGTGSFHEFMPMFYDAHLEHGLSVVAIDGDQEDRVVGAIFSEDFDYILKPELEIPLPDGIEEFFEKYEKWDVIIDCLDILEHHYVRHCKRMGYEKVVHLFFGASCESVRGKGVIPNLLNQTEEIARAKGYDSMFGECTNIFSHIAFGDRANNTLIKVKYDNYVYKDGSKPYFGADQRAQEFLKNTGAWKEWHEGCSEWLYLDEIVLK